MNNKSNNNSIYLSTNFKADSLNTSSQFINNYTTIDKYKADLRTSYENNHSFLLNEDQANQIIQNSFLIHEELVYNQCIDQCKDEETDLKDRYEEKVNTNESNGNIRKRELTYNA